LQADVTDYNALQVGSQLSLGDKSYLWGSDAETVLQAAVAETAKITGGSLDYLIANAAFLTLFDAFDPIGTL
jgi:NAD(P)-dependent dehydrogenase (short-subunit alcohol dehydrogenase family)